MGNTSINQNEIHRLGSKVFDRDGDIRLCGRETVLALVAKLEELDSTFTREIPVEDVEGWKIVKEEVDKSGLDIQREKAMHEDYIRNTSLLYQTKKHYYKIINKEGIS